MVVGWLAGWLGQNGFPGRDKRKSKPIVGSGVYCILNIGIHHKVTCSPTNDCEGNLEHMIGAKGAGDGIRAARGTETESAKKRRPEPDSPIS